MTIFCFLLCCLSTYKDVQMLYRVCDLQVCNLYKLHLMHFCGQRFHYLYVFTTLEFIACMYLPPIRIQVVKKGTWMSKCLRFLYTIYIRKTYKIR